MSGSFAIVPSIYQNDTAFYYQYFSFTNPPGLVFATFASAGGYPGMKITIRTPVQGDHASVFARFTKDLLLQLTPPGLSLNILQYDEPTVVGSIVHLKMRMFGIIRQEWYMHIVEKVEETNRSWFTDEGVRLPGFLKFWRHRHLVEQEGDHTVIVDQVEYKGRFGLLSYLLYPIIWLQFAARKPYYRKFFGKV
jgi:ligand-binding SRPBCC domain-containing protein